MDEEDQTVAEMMRKGTYFSEARAWYQAVYINLISERSFFLLIGVLAALTGLCALIAFSSLMPIVSRRPLLIASPDIDNQVPFIARLHQPKDRLNGSMIAFFAQTYVANRESYIPKILDASQAFVSAHSDPAALTAYLTEISPGNPQSAAHLLAAGGERTVAILPGFSVNGTVEPPIATVNYQRIEVINNQTTRSRWQATLTFHYTPLGTKEVVDKQSGRTIIETLDPQFQVLQYDRKQLQ